MHDLLKRLSISPVLNAPLRMSKHRLIRVLYIINHSMPFSSNGYAVRTHGVASALVRAGLGVIAATRPGTPWDRAGFDGHSFSCSNVIDGVRYVHTPDPIEKDWPLAEYLCRVVEVLKEQMLVFKPVAVMAASNWRNALPAAVAARELGLPFYYEVRGFWELSQAALNPAWAKTAAFQQVKERETQVAQAADKVFTINRFMRDELVQRGVARERIELVPNGFPGWPSSALALPQFKDRLGIKTRFVVGYVGSFNVYEGLEDLIQAVAVARQRGLDVSVLLVGSSESTGFSAGGRALCPASEGYRALAARLGIAEFLFLPGRVAPEQAADYYAVLDVVVIPRRPFAVCEIVSPIKPLEAAAHGKRVLMSDVAPLADLAGLCPNFHYFLKGQVTSLTEKLIAMLSASETARDLSRCQSLESLSWENNVAPIVAAMQKKKLVELL